MSASDPKETLTLLLSATGERLRSASGSVPRSRTQRELSLNLTARWVDVEKRLGWVGPASQQEAVIERYQYEMDGPKAFQPSGPYSPVQQHDKQKEIRDLGVKIEHHRRIVSSIGALIHSFAARILQERKFSTTSRDIFLIYQEKIDNVIAEKAESAFVKLAYAFESTSET